MGMFGATARSGYISAADVIRAKPQGHYEDEACPSSEHLAQLAA